MEEKAYGKVVCDEKADKAAYDVKAYNFKETMSKPERLAPGHRMCAGCGGTIAVRNVLRGLHEGDKAVIGNATGCLEVSTFTYPYTSWEDSYIHNAFENAGATMSGVEGAYKALKKKGKLNETYKFITFGGDEIVMDINGGEISLLVSEDEIARRRETWVCPPLKEAKGCLNIYARMCRPAEEGGAMQPWDLDAKWNR